jgi:hypothetical protein
MKLDLRSLGSLKAPVIIAAIFIWNAGLLFAMHLSGGELTSKLSPTGMKLAGGVCLAACLFSLSIANSKLVQTALIAPSRANNFNSKEFYFVAFLSGVIAVSCFVSPE